MKRLNDRLIRASMMISLVVGLFFTLYYFKAEALAWHLWHQMHIQKHEGLQLSTYQVVIEGKRLGNYKNASGLTYSSATGTLFSVLNDINMIVELTPQGEPLREIVVTGAVDLEGITHVEGEYFVLADERDSRLALIKIAADTRTVAIDETKLLRLGINDRGNKNFEGVSWDSVHNRLIVVKERDPKYVLSVSGFYHPDNLQQHILEVERLKQFDHALNWALRDLSSVTYHAQSGHLFLLSDESKLLKQFDASGRTMGSLALWKNFHGLHNSVPQAEGVTIGEDGTLYIVSEPNLFYVFKPGNLHKHSARRI